MKSFFVMDGKTNEQKSKIHIHIEEIPELIWQKFGFCQDRHFINQIIYLARNIYHNGLYCIVGPSGAGKGEFVKAIAEFINNRAKDIREMIVGRFYDKVILKRKMTKEEAKKILDSIKSETEKYVFVYHISFLEKLKEFWQKEYEFFVEELTGKIFNIYKDFWVWEQNTLYPKLNNYFCSEREDEVGLKFKHINSAQIPRELIESEIFGHKKGSFTGAIADKDGIFSGNSDDTVIFIDEISKAPIELQSKILTAIEERKFRKIGDTKDEELKGIIFFAINRDPKELIKEGNLLEDFWYRISSNLIYIPSLKEHIEHGDSFDDILEFILSQIHTEKRSGKRTFSCPLPDCEFREFETQIWKEEDFDIPVDVKLISHIPKIYGQEYGNFILTELEKLTREGIAGNIRELFNIVKFIIEDRKPWELVEKTLSQARENIKLKHLDKEQSNNESGFQIERNRSIEELAISIALEEKSFSKAKLILSALLWYLKSQNGEEVKISKGTKAKYRKIIKELKEKFENLKMPERFSEKRSIN